MTKRRAKRLKLKKVIEMNKNMEDMKIEKNIKEMKIGNNKTIHGKKETKITS